MAEVEKVVADVTEKEVFDWLIMLQRIIKYAIQAGIAVGAIGYFEKADHLITLVAASSAAMGVVVGIINVLKHKFKIKHGLKFLPLG